MGLLTGLLAVCASPSVRAQEAGAQATADPATEARRQYNLGKTAYEAGRYADGALAWEAAAAIKPHAATLFSAALAWEKANQSERAADDFVRAMGVPGLNAQQTATARERVAQLETTLGSVDATGPTGWRVQIDALTEVPVPARLHASPGPHVLAVHPSSGAAGPPRDVTLEAGKALAVDVTPAQPKPPVAPPPPPPVGEVPPAPPPVAEPPPPAPPQSAPLRRFVGFGLLGMGVATAGAGVVLGLEALGARDAYNAGPTQSSFDHAQSLAVWTDVALIAGGVIAVGGGVLAFLPTAPGAAGAAASQRTGLTVVPTVGGALVRGTF
jgi:hypothetical protein